MRILHTSDWHLGATLAGHERLPEQARFLQWLLDTALAQRIDALLVAGDIYDTVNPPVEAQRLLAWFLVEMRRILPNASVVVTAGNHDSAARLEAPQPFAAALGNLHLVGSADLQGDHCLLRLTAADGKSGAWCLAVPFLRPSDLDCKISADETPEVAYARAVQSFYAHLRDRAQKADPHLPLIVMGHCTLGGSDHAGSERILIGGVESLPAEAISTEADYVAMGHIHRPQRMGCDIIRYSGSPYAMDCDERRYNHEVIMVELGAAGEKPCIESIPVPVHVPLLRFPSQQDHSTTMGWECVEKEVRAYDWEPWRQVPRDLQPLVELVPQGYGLPTQLREKVEALCAGLPLRLVRARWQLDSAGTTPQRAPVDLSSQHAPEEIFLRCYLARHGGEQPSAELLDCFREAAAMAVIQEEH